MVEIHNLMANTDQPLGMDSDPPFHETYKTLFANSIDDEESRTKISQNDDRLVIIEERDPPLIDLSRLGLDEVEKEGCKEEIAHAAHEWGFFQVINHGISKDILEKMRDEQVKVFKQPFHNKCREDKFLNFSAGSYRWGTPTATSLRQLSWSEAFHIPMTDIPTSGAFNSNTLTLSSSMEQFATKVASLAQKLAEILAEKLGHESKFFQEHCLPSTCYLRLNRYPPCPILLEIFGLMPHTDSDFLTILHQDQVGGLQLVKDGKWVAVKPNPEALIINIGDLFQAWSNDTYKSVQHCVVTNPTKERFSAAYFLCPSYETVIESCSKPWVYRKFSFREYRQKVQEDVQKHGYKVGLPRFLI
ncbi:gibberellin 2-beta-dioxygenase 8-like [Durio zibethinus]|uniref:gibberellin 2beta-dioxygenase n=1 Tax=Durio zibethinus TaxID=66656 RepID=A0A6P5X536_DURZI|nr:gibberellin 2-beta-dioxygenase 8-like [Durio zibethinus]